MNETTRSTLLYYSKNADGFDADTATLDMSDLYPPFLRRLRPGTRILDLGCGSGRDSAAFLEMGYDTDSVDGSPELCAIAGRRLGRPVRQMLFEDLKDVASYDGIWACASMLHVPREQLARVFRAMANALVPGGVAYVSFKYGNNQEQRHGRWFTDFTESALADVLLESGAHLVVEEEWITRDKRPEKGTKWLNAILRKS